MAMPHISTLLQFLLFINPSIDLNFNFKTENCLVFDSKTSLPSFNRVCHNHTPTTYEVTTILRYFNERPFTWLVRSKDKQSIRILKQNNLHYRGSFPLMTLHLEHLKSPKKSPLSIRSFSPTNRNLLDQWIAIISQIFFLSPTELLETIESFQKIIPQHLFLYLGFDDDKAVTAGMFIQHNTTITIHKIATLPEHRNQGFASHLMYTMLLDAKKDGCQYATLLSSKKGKNIYERVGFKQHTLYDIYGNYQ